MFWLIIGIFVAVTAIELVLIKIGVKKKAPVLGQIVQKIAIKLERYLNNG